MATAAAVGRLARALPRLELHFDVNKTLIMCDPGGGKSFDDMLNSLLSECCWGSVVPSSSSESSASSSWVPVAPYVASSSPPAGEEVCCYSDFVEGTLLPFRKSVGSDDDEVRAHNKQMKDERRRKKICFCAEGEPGAVFINEFNKLKEALLIPAGKQRDDGMRVAPSLSGGLKEMFASGMHFIVPAFFELLVELTVRRRQDFRIVFRTFGIDIHEISQELNLFCEGLHPLSPEGVRLDGSDPTYPDLRILSSQQHASYFRNGGGPDDLHCAFGTLEQAPLDLNGLSFQDYWTEQPKEKKRRSNSDVDDDNNGETILPVSTFDGVRAEMNERLREYNVIAMRDYYPYWSRQAEADDAGKVLLIDTATPDVAQIFFDDNVERDYAHIVDCRDLGKEGAPITFEHSSGKYLARSEPYSAITDLHYFINLVDSCTRRQHAASTMDS